ncbi:hypothetical protein K525DRAFT_147749, partial [Schizophyllum commune Loenen D]
MNSVNASTGLTHFEMHIGRHPRRIPPLVPESLPPSLEGSAEAFSAERHLRTFLDNEAEARDMLTQAKVNQAFAANARRPSEPPIVVGDRVKVATFNRRQHYKAKGEKRVAK